MNTTHIETKTYRVRTTPTTQRHLDNPSLDTIDIEVPLNICELGSILAYLKQQGQAMGFYPYSFQLLHKVTQ